jgi:hypothetical protein
VYGCDVVGPGVTVVTLELMIGPSGACCGREWPGGPLDGHPPAVCRLRVSAEVGMAGLPVPLVKGPGRGWLGI